MIFDALDSEDERAEIADICQIGQDIHLAILLVRVNNDIERQYISAPVRLFVIAPEGCITFNDAPGPQGFDPEAWNEALKAQIEH